MEKCARFRRPIGGIHTYLPMALIAISLLAPPCTAAPAGPSAATVRQQAITAAWAKCAQRTEAAWKDVLAAEKAEIASLQKATNAAMKSGDASAVVATYKYAAVVRQRLNAESAELPFPAQFSMGTNAGALTPPVRAAELVRNAAVQKALGDYASARLAFRKAVVAADESEVKALQARVRADMRAADAKAVVADVSLLGRAKRTLARAATTFIAAGPQGGTSAGGSLPPFGVPGGGTGNGPLHPGGRDDGVTFNFVKNPSAFPGAGSTGPGRGGWSANGQATPKKDPLPNLPLKYLLAGTSIHIVVRVLVLPDGRVRNVKIVKSSGHPTIDHLFLNAILNHWKFVPARKNNIPIRSYWQESINVSAG